MEVWLSLLEPYELLDPSQCKQSNLVKDFSGRESSEQRQHTLRSNQGGRRGGGVAGGVSGWGEGLRC